MRLLIVNPNTSEGVTARIRAAAEAALEPGESARVVSAASGPALIVSEDDARAATQGVVTSVARYGHGIDGLILASFGDTGAAAVRAARPDLPVLGIAEAACAAAGAIPGPVAFVTFAPEMVPALEAMATHHGLGPRLMESRAVPGPLKLDPADVADLLAAPLLALSREAAAGGAGCVVMGGGPLAGLAAQLAPQCTVPVIDGTQAAVAQMRLRLGAPNPVGDPT